MERARKPGTFVKGDTRINRKDGPGTGKSKRARLLLDMRRVYERLEELAVLALDTRFGRGAGAGLGRDRVCGWWPSGGARLHRRRQRRKTRRGLLPASNSEQPQQKLDHVKVLRALERNIGAGGLAVQRAPADTSPTPLPERQRAQFRAVVARPGPADAGPDGCSCYAA